MQFGYDFRYREFFPLTVQASTPGVASPQAAELLSQHGVQHSELEVWKLEGKDEWVVRYLAYGGGKIEADSEEEAKKKLQYGFISQHEIPEGPVELRYIPAFQEVTPHISYDSYLKQFKVEFENAFNTEQGFRSVGPKSGVLDALQQELTETEEHARFVKTLLVQLEGLNE